MPIADSKDLAHRLASVAVLDASRGAQVRFAPGELTAKCSSGAPSGARPLGV